MAYYSEEWAKKHQEKMATMRSKKQKQPPQAKKKVNTSKNKGDGVAELTDSVLLIVKHRFPSLNDYTNANRTNRYKGAKIKHENTDIVALACKQAKLVQIHQPCYISFTWYDNGRRDPDNVAFAKKFILDGMVKAGVLKNDTWNLIKGFTDEFVKCKKEDAKVLIEIREVK